MGVPDDDEIAPKPPTDSGNEIAWIIDNVAILFRCWVVPTKSDVLTSYTDRERSGVRAVALTVIVILAFVLRSSDGVTISDKAGIFAVIAAAGGVAAGLAVVVDAIANAINSRYRESIIFPAYAATLLTMLTYVFFKRWVEVDSPWWYTALSGLLGWDFTPVLLACLVTWLLWLVKASCDNRWIYRTGWRVAWVDAAQAIAIVAISGLIVYTISQLSDATFCSLIHCPPKSPTP
jgi:hypothetical protein